MTVLGMNVGLSGKFQLKSPFDAKLQQIVLDNDLEVNLIYTVVAKESITSAVTSGGAILDDIYLENGLTEDDYNRDVLDKVNIITLAVAGYTQVRVPESYFEAWPDEDNVPYYQPVIVMPIGPWAMDTDFTFLKKQVEAVVSDVVGVEKSGGCAIHGLQVKGAVSRSQHETIMRKREGLIKTRTTDRAEAARLRIELDEAKKEIVALQALLS